MKITHGLASFRFFAVVSQQCKTEARKTNGFETKHQWFPNGYLILQIIYGMCALCCSLSIQNMEHRTIGLRNFDKKK